MERKFCGLFGKNLKNLEILFYEAKFAFFWNVAELKKGQYLGIGEFLLLVLLGEVTLVYDQ